MDLCVEGFIVSESLYGETSKIINVLTEKYGIIGTMAKGAKSMKSKNRSSTLKFTYGLFNIKYKEGKLSTLVNAEIINPLKTIKNDLTLISYLTYITDLTHQVFKQSNSKKIYKLFIETVLKLENNLDPVILTNILELKYLDFLGVGINLNECSVCGDKKDIITVDASFGGLICKRCYTPVSKIVSLKIIKLLRMYYLVDIKSISNIKIDKNLKEEINLFVKAYYDSYTGLYLHSKDFLNKIINI